MVLKFIKEGLLEFYDMLVSAEHIDRKHILVKIITEVFYKVASGGS